MKAGMRTVIITGAPSGIGYALEKACLGQNLSVSSPVHPSNQEVLLSCRT